MRRLLLDESPPEWAWRHDQRPTVIPDWPKIPSQAVVIVVESAETQETEALLIEDEADLRVQSDPRTPGRRLFFNVPRRLAEEMAE